MINMPDTPHHSRSVPPWTDLISPAGRQLPSHLRRTEHLLSGIITHVSSPDGTDPHNAYGYPSEVPWSKVQRFLEDIGVDPVDRETLMAVDIRPDGVIIERARVREAGDGARRKYSTAKDGGFTATQTTTCRIVWSA